MEPLKLHEEFDIVDDLCPLAKKIEVNLKVEDEQISLKRNTKKVKEMGVKEVLLY